MVTAERNEAIQWLRALAATEVMVWHSDLLTKGFSSFSIQASSYSPMGGIGVEVFFVVSGYLMSFITSTDARAKPFVVGRIRRIFPLYWLFTLLVIGVYLAQPGWHLGGFELTAGNVIQSMMLWPRDGYPILTVGWTLEYEIVFYAMVTVFLASELALKGDLRIAFGPALALLGLVGIILSDALRHQPALAHALSPYMFAFGIGWMLHGARRSRAPAVVAAFVAFAVLAAAGWTIARGHDAVVLARCLLAGLGVAAVLAMRPLLVRTGPVHRLVATIGEASYSIYLCHWFVLSALGKVLARSGADAGADGVARILGCLLAVGVGTVFFLRIERPLDRKLRQAERRASGIAVAT
ncbi:acyltransferase [Aureimonas sp. Leaf454]|uniref:acyltransferase family protein n=1 Tax=Aureimonas sp. Leaf454 TaxID=1736381 RepID=UPI000A54EF50|nr:acyltransferase [Aureimonas sp. Leaf454]